MLLFGAQLSLESAYRLGVLPLSDPLFNFASGVWVSHHLQGERPLTVVLL